MSDGGSGTTHLFCTVSSQPTSPAKTTCPPPPIDTKRPLPAADSASVLSTKASDADLMCLCTNKQVSTAKFHQQRLFVTYLLYNVKMCPIFPLQAAREGGLTKSSLEELSGRVDHIGK